MKYIYSSLKKNQVPLNQSGPKLRLTTEKERRFLKSQYM